MKLLEMTFVSDWKNTGNPLLALRVNNDFRRNKKKLHLVEG